MFYPRGGQTTTCDSNIGIAFENLILLEPIFLGILDCHKLIFFSQKPFVKNIWPPLFYSINNIIMDRICFRSILMKNYLIQKYN